MSTMTHLVARAIHPARTTTTIRRPGNISLGGCLAGQSSSSIQIGTPADTKKDQLRPSVSIAVTHPPRLA
jgi:hypothetical protein